MRIVYNFKIKVNVIAVFHNANKFACKQTYGPAHYRSKIFLYLSPPLLSYD